MKIGAIQAAGMNSYNKMKIQPAKKESVSMGSDKLEISGSPRLFSDALKAAAAAPAERGDRVAAIQAQLASGTYTVNSMAIAGRLIRGVAPTEG